MAMPGAATPAWPARPGLAQWLAAAVVAVACILFGLGTLRPASVRDYDQPLYLGIASDLLQTGVFTNGRQSLGAAEPGAYTAPLYPALIAALAALDTPLADTAHCVRAAADLASVAACPDSLGILVPIQTVLAAGTLLLVWRSTLALGGNAAAAWCALLAAGLGTTELAVYARTAMTEALSVPLSAGAGLLLVLLVRSPGWWLAAGLGLTLGLLTLTRPEYLYLAAAIGLVGAALSVARRRAGPRMLAAGLVAAAVVLPWSVRNDRLFGTMAPTYGYAGFILEQRMAYQAMTPAEWGAEWLYALPGFGPALARDLFPTAVARLGWEDRADTFYMVGNTTGVQALQAAAPNPADQVAYLLHRNVWSQPLWFAAVTLVMAWKGLWVRKYFSLVAVPFFAVMVWGAVRRRDWVRLSFVLPPLFILALHAATSVATPRYSLMLIPAYAASFGLAAGPWLQRRWARA